MEHSFHYRGPKMPSKARGCMSCASALSGMCMNSPPHQAVVAGCGLCSAAESGVCGSHGRGAAKALADYVASLPEDAADRFASVQHAVDAELALMPDSASVQVDVSLHSGLHVDAAGERTGMALQHMSVLVVHLES